ncbi:MAG: hypothetical protein Q3990_05810 [Desulfovibrionaceae bacterium]|nr:hypothetical protein [Desulfovibrionaceae bacterium]
MYGQNSTKTSSAKGICARFAAGAGNAWIKTGAGISAALLALAPVAARAASFGDMADNVKSEMTRFGPVLQAGFALGGFFLVGLGLWQLWARSQQPGSPKGSAIMAIVIGCGLLGAATIAQMGSGTLGTGSPELNEIGL